MDVHLRGVEEADEVTPPLTPAPGRPPERIAWFLEHHRRARAGVDGPAGEATWAVAWGNRPTGAVRLRRLDARTLETGIWLSRSARGHGVGTESMRAVLARAQQEQAEVLQAEAGSESLAMRSILGRLGFVQVPGAPPGRSMMSRSLAQRPG